MDRRGVVAYVKRLKEYIKYTMHRKIIHASLAFPHFVMLPTQTLMYFVGFMMQDCAWNVNWMGKKKNIDVPILILISD